VAHGKHVSSGAHQESAVEPTASARERSEGQNRERGRVARLRIQFEDQAIASEAVSAGQHQAFALDLFCKLEARPRLRAENPAKHDVVGLRQAVRVSPDGLPDRRLAGVEGGAVLIEKRERHAPILSWRVVERAPRHARAFAIGACPPRSHPRA
jgi:hypothetical protein